MTDLIDRRRLLATATLAPLLALPGCASTGGFDLTEAIGGCWGCRHSAHSPR